MKKIKIFFKIFSYFYAMLLGSFFVMEFRGPKPSLKSWIIESGIFICLVIVSSLPDKENKQCYCTLDGDKPDCNCSFCEGKGVI